MQRRSSSEQLSFFRIRWIGKAEHLVPHCPTMRMIENRRRHMRAPIQTDVMCTVVLERYAVQPVLFARSCCLRFRTCLCPQAIDSEWYFDPLVYATSVRAHWRGHAYGSASRGSHRTPHSRRCPGHLAWHKPSRREPAVWLSWDSPESETNGNLRRNSNGLNPDEKGAVSFCRFPLMRKLLHFYAVGTVSNIW